MPTSAPAVGLSILTELAVRLAEAGNRTLDAAAIEAADEQIRSALAPEVSDLLAPPTVVDASTTAGTVPDTDAGRLAARLGALATLARGDATVTVDGTIYDGRAENVTGSFDGNGRSVTPSVQINFGEADGRSLGFDLCTDGTRVTGIGVTRAVSMGGGGSRISSTFQTRAAVAAGLSFDTPTALCRSFRIAGERPAVDTRSHHRFRWLSPGAQNGDFFQSFLYRDGTLQTANGDRVLGFDGGQFRLVSGGSTIR